MAPLTEHLLLENTLLPHIVMKKTKQFWVNDIFSMRQTESEYYVLYPELKKDPQKFYEYSETSIL